MPERESNAIKRRNNELSASDLLAGAKVASVRDGEITMSNGVRIAQDFDDLGEPCLAVYPPGGPKIILQEEPR